MLEREVKWIQTTRTSSPYLLILQLEEDVRLLEIAWRGAAALFLTRDLVLTYVLDGNLTMFSTYFRTVPAASASVVTAFAFDVLITIFSCIVYYYMLFLLATCKRHLVLDTDIPIGREQHREKKYLSTSVLQLWIFPEIYFSQILSYILLLYASSSCDMQATASTGQGHTYWLWAIY